MRLINNHPIIHLSKTKKQYLVNKPRAPFDRGIRKIYCLPRTIANFFVPRIIAKFAVCREKSRKSRVFVTNREFVIFYYKSRSLSISTVYVLSLAKRYYFVYTLLI